MPAVHKLHLLCMSHCHVPVCPCELVLPDLLARTPCRDETLLLSFKETHSGPVPPPPRHHPPPHHFLNLSLQWLLRLHPWKRARDHVGTAESAGVYPQRSGSAGTDPEPENEGTFTRSC